MNPLIWILIEAGLNIAKNHSAGGGAVKLGGFLFDAARALDQLSVEETGQPLDWAKIREHAHLPPPGSPPDDGPDLSMKPGSEPEAIAAAAEPATGPAVEADPDDTDPDLDIGSPLAPTG